MARPKLNTYLNSKSNLVLKLKNQEVIYLDNDIAIVRNENNELEVIPAFQLFFNAKRMTAKIPRPWELKSKKQKW